MIHPFDDLLKRCSQAMDAYEEDIMVGRGKDENSDMLVVVARGKEAEALEAYLEVVEGIDKDDPAYGGVEVAEIAKPIDYVSSLRGRWKEHFTYVSQGGELKYDEWLKVNYPEESNKQLE